MAVEINKHIGFFAEALLRPQLGHIGSGALPAQRPIVFDFALRKKLDLETFTRGSGAMYWDGPAGKLASVGNNVPVREWSARGIFKGRRIEEPRTNLLLWSEAFDNAAWVKNGVSVNPADDISVRGITLHKVVGNGSNFTFLWQEFGEVAPDQVVTFSAYMKQGGAARTAIRFWDNQTPTVQAHSQRIDWTDGVPSFFGDPAPNQLTRLARTIEPVGEGVYRVTLTFRNDTGGPITLRASMYERWDIAPVAGEFTYWGAAQLEAGSFPTSYIKTEGSTATRAADVVSVPSANIAGFDESEATWLVEASMYPGANKSTDLTGTARNPRLIAGGFGSSSTPISVRNNLNTVNAYDGDVMSPAETFLDGEIFKAVAGWDATDKFICMDGGPVVSEVRAADSTSMAFVPVTHDGGNYRIGSGTLNGMAFNGHIRRILYWPKRLPNQQLQLLSKAA